MKIFRFVKKRFSIRLKILSDFINVSSLSCISMKKLECKRRPQIVNVGSNNPIFYSFSKKISKCSGSSNNINDPYAKICAHDIIKNLNVKVFYLMSRTNETRFLKWHEKCECKCRLDAIVCNNKQCWNTNKFRCERKELIDNGINTTLKDLFKILVIVSVNVINHVILVNIWTMKIVNSEKT